MKRTAIVVAVVVFGFTLTSCRPIWDFLTGFIPEAYDDLVGSWTVTSQPDGWTSHRYHFTDDREFEVDYNNLYWTDEYPESVILSAHGGDIVSVNESEFTARIDHSLLGDDALGRQYWVYRWPGSEKNTMELGLIDEDTGQEEYYWTLIRD